MTQSDGGDPGCIYTALGLDATLPKKPTPEEKFYIYLSGGSASRIDNLVYFLKNEIEHYSYIKECGIQLSRLNKAVALQDYVKCMVRYYLQMMHLTRFCHTEHDEDGEKLPKLDMDKVMPLVMADPRIEKLLKGG